MARFAFAERERELADVTKEDRRGVVHQHPLRRCQGPTFFHITEPSGRKREERRGRKGGPAMHSRKRIDDPRCRSVYPAEDVSEKHKCKRRKRWLGQVAMIGDGRLK